MRIILELKIIISCVIRISKLYYCYFLGIIICFGINNLTCFSIYDPPLNTEFDEVEGKGLENESNEISKRIRDIEIELEPKPLPVIDINKPLEKFSWVSLGETIIQMHNYIAEEKLVSF